MAGGSKGESKRGFASLTKSLPLPLSKGKGIKGMGSPYYYSNLLEE